MKPSPHLSREALWDAPRPALAVNFMAAPPPSKNSGFTLVELLVATAVTALLLLIVLSLTNSVLGNYEKTQGRIRQESDAAFVLDSLVTDLESVAADGGDDAERLRLETGKVGDAPNLARTAFLARSLDADEMETTPSGDRPKFPGARRLVTYRVAHQNPVDGSSTGTKAYVLFRDVLPGNSTFANAVGNMTISDKVADADSRQDTDFLAENIVGFQIRFLKPDGSWTTPQDKIRISGYGFWADPGGAFDENHRISGMPVRAEISITVLSPKGAKQLEGGRPFDDVVREHARTYTRQTAVFPSGT
jgi:prepilin-type N-terminal cleavage/methylation domain-containing protein